MKFLVKERSGTEYEKKKALTVTKLKKRELAILVAFQGFCKSYGLRFYLAGGNFIKCYSTSWIYSWDDDIDVCMPRNDYEKLLQTYFFI